FPRRDPGALDPLVADRHAGRACKGDRDVRADDRLLFLQLLAAARDAFYVSWIGQDIRSNKPLPPSVVVDELMREVREHYLARGGCGRVAGARTAASIRRETVRRHARTQPRRGVASGRRHADGLDSRAAL